MGLNHYKLHLSAYYLHKNGCLPITYVINQFTQGNIQIKLYLHIIITFNSPSVQGY